ncbi:MAG TPA: hypothetical protein VJN96_19125 [Vicinamibacterales bacterium]|nr:hypothetical protein [Vicinamibacterales bacterium]
MALNDQHVRALLAACQDTHATELTCDEFLDAMPAYAELCAAGNEASPAFAAARAHVRLCGDCRDEFQGLIQLLTAKE